MKKKDKPEMKVTYIYREPKTEAEAKEAQWRLDRAYDILFGAALKELEAEGYAPELLDKFRLWLNVIK